MRYVIGIALGLAVYALFGAIRLDYITAIGLLVYMWFNVSWSRAVTSTMEQMIHDLNSAVGHHNRALDSILLELGRQEEILQGLNYRLAVVERDLQDWKKVY